MKNKKTKKPRNKANAPVKSAPAAKKGIAKDRRKLLALALAIPVVGIAGAAIHRYDVNKRSAHDLSSVGAGSPVVVQVHDPACGLCRSLMTNSKKALKDVPGVLFRIADVTTLDGSDFQSQYGEPNVTLLLFDGRGKLRQTIRGVTPVDELREAFKALI